MNQDEVELAVLTLSYERYVSRSHTIFATFFDILFGLVVGTLGIVLALIEVNVIEFNRLIFFVTIILLLWIMTIIGIAR